jgi:hypothetical protein
MGGAGGSLPSAAGSLPGERWAREDEEIDRKAWEKTQRSESNRNDDNNMIRVIIHDNT